MCSLKLGDVVCVITVAGNPLTHCSRAVPELGGSGTRGRVVGIGPKWIKVSSIGNPLRVAVKSDIPWSWVAEPVPAARARYAAMLQYHGRTKAEAEELASRL